MEKIFEYKGIPFTGTITKDDRGHVLGFFKSCDVRAIKIGDMILCWANEPAEHLTQYMILSIFRMHGYCIYRFRDTWPLCEYERDKLGDDLAEYCENFGEDTESVADYIAWHGYPISENAPLATFAKEYLGWNGKI